MGGFIHTCTTRQDAEWFIVEPPGSSLRMRGMRNSSKLTRWAAPAGAAVLAATLVACGSNNSSDGSSTSSTGSGSGIVGVSDVSGVGDVLVDGSGMTLYFSNQESHGTVKCTDACLGFWTPAQASGNLPNDIKGLSVITRSDDGEKQLAFDGAPLYTFALDHGPGETNGNDVSDSFGGTSFTWHAAVTKEGATSDMSGGNSGGYGGSYSDNSDNSGNGSGYSY